MSTTIETLPSAFAARSATLRQFTGKLYVSEPDDFWGQHTCVRGRFTEPARVTRTRAAVTLVEYLRLTNGKVDARLESPADAMRCVNLPADGSKLKRLNGSLLGPSRHYGDRQWDLDIENGKITSVSEYVPTD